MFLEAESFYICLFLLPACVRWMQMNWDELVWMTWKTWGDLNWRQLFCEELCRWKWIWKQHVFPPMIATLVVGSWLKHWNLSCNSSWQIWQLFSGLLQVDLSGPDGMDPRLNSKPYHESLSPNRSVTMLPKVWIKPDDHCNDSFMCSLFIFQMKFLYQNHGKWSWCDHTAL